MIDMLGGPSVSVTLLQANNRITALIAVLFFASSEYPLLVDTNTCQADANT